MRWRVRARRNAEGTGWRLTFVIDGAAPYDRAITFQQVNALNPDDWHGRAAAVGLGLAGLLFDNAPKPVTGVFELEALPSDSILALPWELLRHPTEGFYAAAGWGVVRVIEKQAAAPPQIDAPPRVLVIVGASPNDPAIRAGAEYLGLLRTVQGIRTRLVVSANERTLRAHVVDFQPHVVHFICHGGTLRGANPAPFLSLVDPMRPAFQAQLFADGLIAALRDATGALPPIVVLNACNTAGDDAIAALGAMNMPSLAAQLVERGVDLAIGHAGEADDQVCRLFTRRFYEALVEGADVVEELGRIRAALGQDVKPGSVGWATMRVFARALPLHAGGSVCAVSASGTVPAQLWAEALMKSVPRRDDRGPPFCDRCDVLSRFDTLVSGDRVQIASGRVLRYLILRSAGTASTASRKYGLTYTLKELWRRAASEGHLAVRLRELELAKIRFEDVPQADRPLLITDHILTRLEEAAIEFGIPNAVTPWKRTLRQLEGHAKHLADNLTTLIGETRKVSMNPEALVVLLIDDLHRLGTGVLEGFLDLLICAEFKKVAGLRLVGAVKMPEAATAFTEWDHQGSSAVTQEVELKDFCDQSEQELAHLQYTRSFPGVAGPSTRVLKDSTTRDKLFVAFRVSQGPHDLQPGGIAAQVVDALTSVDFLIEANDERRLQEMAQAGGTP